MNTRHSLEKQNEFAQNHYTAQLEKIILAFNEQGFNVAPYWENNDLKNTLSIVPTSAVSGEGLSDLVTYLCKMGPIYRRKKMTENPSKFECTVIEVKIIEGLGTTIDVILVNGTLRVGDTIVISGLKGPIETNIRALLTP